MGWRFRKSFKILPGVNINIGKKGITSASIGRGGLFSTNVSKKGIKHSISAPGTGLSYQTKPTSLFGSGESSQAAALPAAAYERYWECFDCQGINYLNAGYCSACRSLNENKQWLERPIAEASLTSRRNVRAWAISLIVAAAAVIGMQSCLTKPSSNSSTPIRSLASTPNNRATPSPSASALPKKGDKAAKRNSAKALPAPLVTSSDDSGSGSGTTKRRVASSGRYMLGPRGGCYYINGNGNKTYVDRSLCS
ncbi:MAG: DUF4236 domain-containing protein [Pyrinomonadaceae bacterium]